VWHCQDRRALQAAEKSLIGQESMPQGLNSLQKNALYEGHGFSRAVTRIELMRALAPGVRFFVIPRALGRGNGSKKPYLSG
jgi:hypothetical protein